jgi:hypothetical protein
MLKTKLLNIKTSTRNVKCTNAHSVNLSRWLGRSMDIFILVKDIVVQCLG